ncbi:MAG: exo-alpha-sialidase [Chloroflexi bacterium]|nr:MAG: exo-alpha-sialidase [Chloroflexota bacterium]
MRLGYRWFAVGAASALTLLSTIGASANVPLTKISSDPYTNSTSQHATQVEPDTFSFGNTIVAAFQEGRFTDGGSSNIGWATSADGGTTWTHGDLPGTTVYATPAGSFARDTDPAVAYDPKRGVWLIAQLPLDASVNGAGVIVSRSTNGGTVWGNPITVVPPGGINSDKSWIVCDTWASSPFYGNCYIQWDDHGAGNLIYMNTSTDGGLTWGPKTTTAQGIAGIGGQPVVQPSGTVVVPLDNANETAVGAFSSTNGGASWGNVTTITSISHHTDAGNIRSGALPTAEIDGAGKVFVAWSDSRFIRAGKANDIVFTSSSNGTTWSAVTRIPLDATNSGVDHFIPGLAVNKATSGGSAHLALYYYYYPVSNCTSTTCQLNVGFSSSANGGASWTAGNMQAGPMTLSWLPSTTQGVMVGDYISASYNSGGTSHGVFAVANPNNGSVFDEAMYTNTAGQASATVLAADSPKVYGSANAASFGASNQSHTWR